jgi:flagellin-like hook-associated protein FlgL
MSEVTLSQGVRQNLLSLQNTAALLGKTQERLATGKKVNSALDNPINFFTASGLQARAGDLGRLLDSVGNALQTVKAADQGITSITKLIESAEAVARSALTAEEADVTYDYNDTGSTLADDAAVAAVDAGTMTIQVGSGAVETLTFGVGDIQTQADLTAALATITGLTATFNASEQIELDSTSSESITIGGTAATLADLGFAAGTFDPTATVNTASDDRTDLQTQYNSLLTQITQMASDASFNGVNLINSDDLTVDFNEDGTSSLTINGVDFSATGLGLTAISGDGFQIDANIDAAIAALDTATTTLRTQAATFGSNLSIVQARQDFTKNMINVLQVGADNLVLADSNEEGANMLALNTRQQLSTVALSLAAQADQNVLQLF